MFSVPNQKICPLGTKQHTLKYLKKNVQYGNYIFYQATEQELKLSSFSICFAID